MPEIISHPLTEQELGQMGPPQALVSQEGFFVRHPEKETVLAGLDRARVTAHDERWTGWLEILSLQKAIDEGARGPVEVVAATMDKLIHAKTTYRTLASNHNALKTAEEEWENNWDEFSEPEVIIHFNRTSFATFMVGAIKTGIEKRQEELAERRQREPDNPKWRPLREVQWLETDHIRLDYRRGERIVPISLIGVLDPPDKGIRPVQAAQPDSGGTYTDAPPYTPPPPDTRPPDQRHLPHLHGVNTPKSWKSRRKWWQR
jgi:hypothetical protein